MTISILGCGRTGIQTAVFLLDQYGGKIIVYDDDASYAQGMALDCSQASSLEGYRGIMRSTKSLSQLNKADILIVCEQRNEELSEQWEKFARFFSGICIYAGQDIEPFRTFVEMLPHKRRKMVFAVHGIVDAALLATEAAKCLDVSVKDVHAAVYGGVGAKMQSKSSWVRAAGIPINEIKKGAYKTALAAAKKACTPLKKGPWHSYYVLASAAVKAALCVTSATNVLLSITIGEQTLPAILTNEGYVEYMRVKKNDEGKN